MANKPSQISNVAVDQVVVEVLVEGIVIDPKQPRGKKGDKLTVSRAIANDLVKRDVVKIVE
jgi:hypothetical protein